MTDFSDEQLEASNDWLNSRAGCEKCYGLATVYAMGKGSGDWGGYYCDTCIPTGFMITDRLSTKE